jgi:hypothetical protein
VKDEHGHIRVGLTLEDDFTLTRLKNAAHSLKGEARDQYLWKTIFRFICRERAYKSVMETIGVAIDTNVSIFDDSGEQTD